MIEYLVEWAIELDAETPQEAARLAFEILQDPDSIATVFTVRASDDHRQIFTVDVAELPSDSPDGPLSDETGPGLSLPTPDLSKVDEIMDHAARRLNEGVPFEQVLEEIRPGLEDEIIPPQKPS